MDHPWSELIGANKRMKNEIAKLVRPLFSIATIALAAVAAMPHVSLGVENTHAPQTQTPEAHNSVQDSEVIAKFKASEQLEWNKWILRKKKAELYQANSPTLGASQPKVTIVEFFDYNCQYCRKVQPLLQDFLAKNPDVQIILKDAAFLSKDSRAVGKIMLAAQKQKNISELHNAMMNRKGPNTDAAILAAADSLGFDVQRLKKEANASDVNNSIQQAQNLAIDLRVEGTPFFIVGHTILSGGHTELQEKLAGVVDEIRQKGCDVC